METTGNSRPDLVCKLVIIGDSGVGKTCVMRRFTDDEFSEKFVETIGIDLKIRFMNIKGKSVKVQIWDTAGQERFQSIPVAYYRGAKGVIIAYDITDQTSFDHVTKWVRKFKRFGDIGVERMLIGNKCDKEDARMVWKEEGEKLAKENEMFFSETSAKDNINIDYCFTQLLEKIVDKFIQQLEHHQAEEEKKRVVALERITQNNKSKLNCCEK